MLVVVALHWIASFKGYYWTTSWYDIMMHFLGGLFVFIAALWALNTQYAAKLAPYITLRNLLIFVFVVGFLWEAHEIVLKFADVNEAGYSPDTIDDLINDMLGAGLAAFIFRKSIPRKIQ